MVLVTHTYYGNIGVKLPVLNRVILPEILCKILKVPQKYCMVLHSYELAEVKAAQQALEKISLYLLHGRFSSRFLPIGRTVESRGRKEGRKITSLQPPRADWTGEEAVHFRVTKKCPARQSS